MKKVWMLLLALCLMASLLCGCGEPKETVFSANGINLTLTEDFEQFDVPGYTVAYQSKEMVVIALQEPFSLAPGAENLSLDEYAALIMQSNGLGEDDLSEKNGIPFFEYDYYDAATDQDFHYFSYLFKTDDAFWVVQYATLVEDAATWAAQADAWAQTVTFD